MSTIPLRSREEIPEQYRWNATSLFDSVAAWHQELQSVHAAFPALAALQGTLGESPQRLLAAIDLHTELSRREYRVYLYAMFSYAVDTSSQPAIEMLSQARSLHAKAEETAAFMEPEIILISPDVIGQWLEQESRLAILEHYFRDLQRKKGHMRSTEIESLLSGLADTFSGISGIASMLTNADMIFEPAQGEDGHITTISQSNFDALMKLSDRETRRNAWRNYHDQYLAHKNSLAAAYETSIKSSVYLSRAHHHPSNLAAALYPHHIPEEVFHNLIDTFIQYLPTWHRYWRLRRKALQLEDLQPYDVWAPLSSHPPRISYEQAVAWICQGLAPLGKAYVERLRRGCLQERWVDVFPNHGKRKGAFSTRAIDNYPFIMMSYDETIFGLSTLAHELGHSMHALYTAAHQPLYYHRYSLFVAEVASNFNQALVRAHLLKTITDPSLRLVVIEEAMSNFYRYFLVMPTLARLEWYAHQRVEQGIGLTARSLIDAMAQLFAETMGDEMALDPERVGITWATFGHLYTDFYTFQYATGISGAHTLARKVLAEGEPAVESYLAFLSAGSSGYALDILREAGVDLTTPQPVIETFAMLDGLLAELEVLIGSSVT